MAMTPSTLTLDEFLLARIAEDEQAAIAADIADYDNPVRSTGSLTPWRLRRECEAKRLIVGLHRTYINEENEAVCAECLFVSPCKTLRTLALPYADHPDYLEEWRP
jgi:hypothetical protein